MEPVYPRPDSPPYFETPSENIINPICDMVENASTLLISVCVHATTAANKAENAPTQVTICRTVRSWRKPGIIGQLKKHRRPPWSLRGSGQIPVLGPPSHQVTRYAKGTSLIYQRPL